MNKRGFDERFIKYSCEGCFRTFMRDDLIFARVNKERETVAEGWLCNRCSNELALAIVNDFSRFGYDAQFGDRQSLT